MAFKKAKVIRKGTSFKRFRSTTIGPKPSGPIKQGWRHWKPKLGIGGIMTPGFPSRRPRTGPGPMPKKLKKKR